MTNITNSFQLVLTILRYIGLYSDGKPSKLFKVWTYILYSSSVVLTVLAFVNLFTEENINIMQVTQMVVFVANSGAGCLKFLQFLINKSRIKKCVEYFADQRFEPRNDTEEKIMEDCLYVCQRNVKIFAYVLVFTEIWWNIIPLFEKEYRLPVKIWLPYELSGRATFYATYVCVVTAAIYLGLTALLEPLLGGLAYHATTQIKILKYNLLNLSKDMNKQESDYSTVGFECVFETLQQCILLHNNIIGFVAEFENCFSWCIFFQIAGTIIALCFCCIGLSIISSVSVDAVVFVTCYFVISFQLIFYCHYGTLLYEESKELMDAIYMSPWQKYDVRVRKMLVTMMERAKIPLKVTAGKVMVLTYETFTSTIKTSYSLIAVLNNYV